MVDTEKCFKQKLYDSKGECLSRVFTDKAKTRHPCNRCSAITHVLEYV